MATVKLLRNTISCICFTLQLSQPWLPLSVSLACALSSFAPSHSNVHPSSVVILQQQHPSLPCLVNEACLPQVVVVAVSVWRISEVQVLRVFKQPCFQCSSDCLPALFVFYKHNAAHLWWMLYRTIKAVLRSFLINYAAGFLVWILYLYFLNSA